MKGEEMANNNFRSSDHPRSRDGKFTSKRQPEQAVGITALPGHGVDPLEDRDDDEMCEEEATPSGQIWSTEYEAIAREVVESIEAGDVDDAYEEFDIDAIAKEYGLTCDGRGYWFSGDPEEFWDIVQKHAL